MKKLKIAIVGGGFNSAVGKAHLSAIRMDGMFEIIGAKFNRQPASNKQSAAAYNLPESILFDDLQLMMEQLHSLLDAVIILTPTPKHFEHINTIAQFGVPIICEKALVSNMEQLSQVHEIISKNNALLLVTMNYSGYPMVQEAKAIIQQGRIGQVQQIHIEMPQDGYVRRDATGELIRPQSWRQIDDSIPTIALDLAVHTNHLVDFLTSETPLKTCAVQHHCESMENIVDDISAISIYSNNLKVTTWVSKIALGYKNGLRFRVFGDRGAIEWVQLEPDRLKFTDQTGSESWFNREDLACITNDLGLGRFKAGHPTGFIESFANLYQLFAQGITEHKNNVCSNPTIEKYSLHAVDKSLRLLSAMRKSSEQMKWIDVL